MVVIAELLVDRHGELGWVPGDARVEGGDICRQPAHGCAVG